MTPAPPLLVIAGPTCTGKTALSVEVAVRHGRAEIVNADSRQVRSGLHVGTCAPTVAELRGVPSHLFGVVEPGVAFTAGNWLVAVRRLIAEIRDRGAIPVVVGGTGLYLRALLRGYLPPPPPDPARRLQRNRLAESDAGRRELVAELRRRDPGRWAVLDGRNPRRVIRRLEALDAGLDPGQDPAAVPAPLLVVGLDTDRERHAGWVRERAWAMVSSGRLQAETAAALGRGVQPDDLAACGIGYAEALAVLRGTLDVDAAAATISRRTLRYVRQQRTFLRAEAIGCRLDAAEPNGDLADRVLSLIGAAV